MRKFRQSFFIFTSFLSASIAFGEDQLASAKVLSISGSPYVQSGDDHERPIAVGDVLTQGDTLKTEASSKVYLVFSNGSELKLKSNTSLLLKELSQESFIAYKSYEELEADPSKSKWALKLNYGEVSFHVKQLRADSEFSIETELGTAFVYGTSGEMGYFLDPRSNQFVISVLNKDGLIDLVSKFSKDVDFGRGNSTSIPFNASGKQDKKFIPPGHVISILQSSLDPDFKDLLQRFISNVVDAEPIIGPEIQPPFMPIDQPNVSGNTSVQ